MGKAGLGTAVHSAESCWMDLMDARYPLDEILKRARGIHYRITELVLNWNLHIISESSSGSLKFSVATKLFRPVNALHLLLSLSSLSI